MGEEVVVSALVALVVALLTTFTTMRSQRDRLRTELRTQFMAEEAIVQLLEHKDWGLRSFEEIKKRIGGFDDDTLRQMLVRAGAVRFYRRHDGAELWGLRRRNLSDLD